MSFIKHFFGQSKLKTDDHSIVLLSKFKWKYNHYCPYLILNNCFISSSSNFKPYKWKSILKKWWHTSRYIIFWLLIKACQRLFCNLIILVISGTLKPITLGIMRDPSIYILATGAYFRGSFWFFINTSMRQLYIIFSKEW